jgi:hypothetical protein
MNIDWNEICNAYDLAWEKAGQQMQELFGDKDNLPDDEMEIVGDDKLYPTHEDKVAALFVLRAGKQVKPKSFAKRLTLGGRISSHGLGIRLD